MNDAATAETATGRVPVHLWIVGIVTLLWNCYGGYEYVMEMTRNPAYMAEAGAELDQVLDALPTWVTAGWALAVWGSLAGSLLLLLRSRYATIAYGAALIGAVSSFGYQLAGISDPAVWVMPLVITTVIAAQLWYSVWMKREGVLR